MADQVMIIKNEFVDETTSEMVDGYFFLIPDLDSYDTLFGALGIPV